MMKKVWLVLLAVVLAFGFVVIGCSSGGDDDPPPAPSEKFVFEGPFVYELWGDDKPVYDEATGLLAFDKVTGSMGFYINFADIGYTYNAGDKLIFTYYVEVETPAAALLAKGVTGSAFADPGSSGGAGYGQGKAWEYVLGDDKLSVHTGPLVDGTWDSAAKTGTIEVLMGLFKSSITGIGFQHNPWCDMGGGGKIAENSKYKLKFTKVENAVSDVDTTPVAPPVVDTDFFEAAVGLKTGIDAQNKASFDEETGIIDLSDDSGSALFTLTLPSATSATGTKKIKVTYAVLLVGEATQAKLTWKLPSWGDPPNIGAEDNQYPELEYDKVATIELSETAYADGTTTIAFQRNGDNESNTFKLKIISVVIE